MSKDGNVIFGSEDLLKDLQVIESKEEGWKKRISAMQIDGIGCFVHTSTTYYHADKPNDYSTTSIFIPFAVIADECDDKGNVVGRRLVHPHDPSVAEEDLYEAGPPRGPIPGGPPGGAPGGASHQGGPPRPPFPPMDPRFRK